MYKGRVRLMVPGPAEIFEETAEAMGQPVAPHFGARWVELYQETIRLLQTIFRTKGDVYLATTSGSGVMDAAIGSLLYTGEKVLLLDNGPFIGRLREIVEGYGLRVATLSFPHSKPVDPDVVRDYLRDHSDIALVAVIGNETMTGVVNPMRELAQVAHAFDLPLFVDGVSAVGGVDIHFDEWDLDICCTVANKCLEAPPGLGIVALSPRAWQIIEAKKEKRHHGWYHNLSVWKWYREDPGWRSWHPYPTTQATNNILALRESLKRIVEVETLEGHYDRYERAKRIVRKGLSNLGFQMVSEDGCASPTVTAAWKPDDVDVREFLHYMECEHGFMLAGGFWELTGRIIRFAHMGLQSTDGYLIPCLLGIEQYLRTIGRDVPKGSSLVGLEY